MPGTMRMGHPDAEERAPDLVGRVIEQHRVVRPLGQGGMATVYEAVHERLGQLAAVKILDPVLGRDPQVSARFFNEARAASLLSHPSVVRVISFGRLEDETAYLLMELLRGETLADRFGKGGQRYHPSYVRLVRQIATGMAAVHEEGIVHRDLKMQNIMVVPDPEAPSGERVKIMDFGVAKLRKEHYHPDNTLIQTRAGLLLGTPLYMSPEQCAGETELTDRADVYSLGAVFYRLLSGEPLFSDTDVVTLVRKQRYSEPRPLGEVAPLLPRELVLLVGAMLAKDPKKRPSMRQVQNALEPYEDEERLPASSRPRSAAAAPEAAGAWSPSLAEVRTRGDEGAAAGEAPGAAAEDDSAGGGAAPISAASPAPRAPARAPFSWTPARVIMLLALLLGLGLGLGLLYGAVGGR